MIRRPSDTPGSAIWDPRVEDWLDDVVRRLHALGVTDLLEDLVARVWERNVDRHDPEHAGDTATSLGITSSENLRTLLLREAEERAHRGVLVTAPQNSVVIAAAGVLVHLMKVPDARDDDHHPDAPAPPPDWTSTRWSGASEVRQGAATENAQLYEPRPEHQWGQTWLEGLGPGADDPRRLRHLVLVWSGDPVAATTTGWLAVPYAGPQPWLAVHQLWRHGPDDVPGPDTPAVVALPMARPPLDTPLTPRRSPR